MLAAPSTSITPVRLPDSGISLLSDEDLHYFNEGTHVRIYQSLGAHPLAVDGKKGVYFAVWAPDADGVSVMGDFNAWNKTSHPLRSRGSSGIWEGFLPGVKKGDVYKYHVSSRFAGYRVAKADPISFLHETPPQTGSIVWDLEHAWNDQAWMDGRWARGGREAPVATYEMHIGSWRRRTDDGFRPLTYRELAAELPAYVAKMGFTHVEFLPVMEHPFYGSWGYQTLGYFAPTHRYGTPQDFMSLVDALHQAGIGVILDWVPSHFPTDEHGLGYFDGTHLYEHADPREGFHNDWKSFIFNHGRNEVRSFLISSALFWLDLYHADGLRVDAVASMLYRDYSRAPGEWIPNQFGGNENLEAIDFLRRLNQEVFRHYPQCQTIAEESTAYPMVSRPTYVGGLGFGYKWDMGWMHDMLDYMSKDPVHRKFHHNNLTFRMLYAWFENYVLPLSHDEVTHGKGSLIGKMPGDYWQKFANLRLLYGYMYGQPGKKLLFMGGEIAQWNEWDHEDSVEWPLLDYPIHSGLQRWVADLNRVYRAERAMHELDADHAGFEWVDCNDIGASAITFLRKSKDGAETILGAFNFTPVPRTGYRVGVPHGGFWREILNGDAMDYGGSGMGNAGGVAAQPIPTHGRPYSVAITIPPLAAVYFKHEGER